MICWCGEDKIWCECFECGGTGDCDGAETGPLDYDPMATCPLCFGYGGWYTCANVNGHERAAERMDGDAKKLSLESQNDDD